MKFQVQGTNAGCAERQSFGRINGNGKGNATRRIMAPSAHSSIILHKSSTLRVGIAATTSKQSAMLPVTTARMSGANRLQKTGNILLDSGDKSV